MTARPASPRRPRSGPQRGEKVAECAASQEIAPGASSARISVLEEILANRIERSGLPSPARQFKFCPTRRWRADFAYPDAMLLIEVDGGTWSGGRHVRGKGFENDCEKTSTAAALGYRVLRFTRDMIEDGRAVALIRLALPAPQSYAANEQGEGGTG